MSPGLGVDWALASNGATAIASSQIIGSSWNGPASAAIDGDRIGANWYNPANGYTGSAGWNDATGDVWPDWLEVDFAGSETINEIDVFTVQTWANYHVNHVPTPSDTSLDEGLIDYQIQYCPPGITCTSSDTSPYGTGWVDVIVNGTDIGHITNNSNTWRHVVFAPVQTAKIRVLTNNGRSDYSRIVEVEAWDTSAVGKNWALAANGATATVTSNYSSNFSAGNGIDGDRSAWGYPNGVQAMWCSAQSPSAASPDIYAVTFAGSASISEIDLFGQQDNKTAAIVPTPTLASTLFAYQQFYVQYCPSGTTCSSPTSYPGTGWVNVPGSPASSTLVWNRFQFPVVETQQIRAVFTSIADHDYSRIAEIEAWDFSNTSGAGSSSYTTAMELRRQMAGATGCGAGSSAIQPTTIGGVAGYEEACSNGWIDWSATTGAWFLPAGDDSGAYLGSSHWPATSTANMNNLGYQYGPYVGAEGSNNYSTFQSGIIATASGTTTPYLIGGVPQCSAAACAAGTLDNAGCSCAANMVNAGLAATWYRDMSASKYPSSSTTEFSFGVCGSSMSGERAFRFNSRPVLGGISPATTYITRDGSPFAYEITGADRAAWASASCATQTALGLPLSNETPYPLASGSGATHQEFEGGTIKYEPSGCSGTDVSTIVTSTESPAHTFDLSDVFCSLGSSAGTCTNGPPIPFTVPLGSDTYLSGSYYYHCSGADHYGAGTPAGSGWYDGITIDTQGGAEYSVDDPMFQYWLSLGADQLTVVSAIAANPPPNHTAPWAFNENGVMANYGGDYDGSNCYIDYVWACGFVGAPPCPGSAGDVSYNLQYTTASGYVSPWSTTTIGSAWGKRVPLSGNELYGAQVQVACGDYDCVDASYYISVLGAGSALETTAPLCAWATNDNIPRPPTRLTLTLHVSTSSGTPNEPVLAQLDDKVGDVTVLDSSAYSSLWTPGQTYSFDLVAEDFNDINNITEIYIDNTDAENSLCVDSMTLSVDDDGNLNGGDVCNSEATAFGCTGGTGAAYRTLYSRNFSPAACSPDPNNIFVSTSELRSSLDWGYQLLHWSSVVNWFAESVGLTVPNHFNGLRTEADLASYLTAPFATKLELKYPFSMSKGSPMGLGASDEFTNYAGILHLRPLFTDNLTTAGWNASWDYTILNYCYPSDGGVNTVLSVNNFSASTNHWWEQLDGVDYVFQVGVDFAIIFGVEPPSPQLPSLGSILWYSWVPNTSPSTTPPPLPSYASPAFGGYYLYSSDFCYVSCGSGSGSGILCPPE